MLPIHMLPAAKTLRVLSMNRLGLRSFDHEQAAKLVERGYAQVSEGRLLITEAGKQASKIIAATPQSFAAGHRRAKVAKNRT
jgi:hypothetical protein